MRHHLTTRVARSLADCDRRADDYSSRPAPFRIPVSFEQKNGLILLDQVHTIDKQRLLQRLGAVEHETLAVTLARLRDMFEE